MDCQQSVMGTSNPYLSHLSLSLAIALTDVTNRKTSVVYLIACGILLLLSVDVCGPRR
jgi:hypothetical protein